MKPKNARRSSAVLLLVLVLLPCAAFLPRDAVAFTFDLSESEWAWWPDYCKARYLDLGFQASGAVGPPMSKSEIATWRSHIGPEVFTYIHHHCAGLVWLQRARLAVTPTERDFALRSADYESNFTLARIPAGTQMHAEILVHLGRIKRAAGDESASISYFDQAIKSLPTYPGGYQGKAMIYRDRRETDKAVQVLEAGSKATEGKSAELEYYLGLTLLEARKPEAARMHAKRAYDQGFPLPALRDRLAAAGYPLD